MFEFNRAASALPGFALLVCALPASGAGPATTAPQACQSAIGNPGGGAADFKVTRAQSRAQPGSVNVCDVTARLESGSSFRVSMPANGWNGALAEARCGPECRQSPERLCDSVVARGYACFAGAPASTDVAHASLVAARSIVSAHYHVSPRAAVLLSCSAGAGTALQQAAEFPTDFQGIVAGAPVLDDDADRRRLRWMADTLRTSRGKPLLSPDDLARLHARALAACDAKDGLEDGLISDPLRCQVPIRALQCAQDDALVGDRTRAATCLRREQVEAVARLYAGPPDDPASGVLPGSELGWALLVGSVGRPAARPSALERVPPDLREFAAAGGKLLLFQGLADTRVAPRQTAEMYERYTRTLGGPVKATGYLRLFMVPGMAHCGGGDGPYQVDFLRGIENWTVNARRAPDDLIAFRPRSSTAVNGSLFAPAAVDPAQNVFSSWQVGVTVTLAESRDQPHASFSRPLYVYPVHTHYKGVGDPDFWRSFYGPYDYPYLLK